MRVFVYRNLHKNCLSVKDLKTGLVVAHVDSITLENAKFKVSKKGRDRVLREKRKNVHAGVEGLWVKTEYIPSLDECNHVIYDPYKYSTFVSKEDLEPQAYAPKVYITIRGAFILRNIESF